MSMADSISAGDGRRGLLKKFDWTSPSSIAQMLAGIASVIVLTRFLTPSDYGLYGIAFIAVAATEVLTSGAMSSPVEQKQDISRRELTTAFWANLALAVALGTITISLSALIAPAAAWPAALPVIAAVCVLVTISAAGIVPESLLRRQQAFQPLAAWFVKSTTGFGLHRQFAILVPPMAASLVMGASVCALWELERPQLPTVPALGLLIASGVAIYLAAL